MSDDPYSEASRTSNARTERLRVLGEIVRRPGGRIGLLVVLVLLFVYVFAPALAPYDPGKQDISHRLEGPSAAHALGTDHLGRDLLSRLLVGTRIALGTAFPAVLGALIVGLAVGMSAGYLGGWIDNVVLVILDAVQAFPSLILALVLLSVLETSTSTVILVIMVAATPGYARVARAQVLSAKQEPYVEVERALGAGELRILVFHILPNIIAPLFILLAMGLPGAIAFEAGLSFLGLGVRPPTPSWGIILANGFSRIRTSPWPVLWASLALTVATLGITIFGETLRDVFDPKMTRTRRV